MDNRNQLLASIKKLRNLKHITFATIDESILGNEDKIYKYFDAPFNSQTDIEFEKLASTAVIKSTYSSSIPEFAKKNLAQIQVRQIVEALRYAKLDYKFETESITAKTYQKMLKKNFVAQNFEIFKKCKNEVLLKGAQIGVGGAIGLLTASLGIAAVPATMVGVVSWSIVTAIDILVPQEIKEKIKKNVHEATTQCIGMAKRAVTKLKEAGQKIAEKLSPVIAKVSSALEKVGKAIKAGRKTTKQTAKKMWDKFFG